MPSSADLYDIYTAVAAWETTELQAASVALVPGSTLIAFATFPTEDDVSAGLYYPYTCHGCDTSQMERVGINEVTNTMVEERHTIWTVLVYGKDGDPLDALSKRDAKWRIAYWAGLLKHLKLTDKNVTFEPRVTIEPTAFDLYNRPEIGIKVTMRLMTRKERATGY